VERDDVAGRQEIGQGSPRVGRLGARCPRPVEDLGTHRAQDGCQQARHRPVADEAHDPPADLAEAVHLVRRPAPAQAGAGRGVEGRDAAQAGQQERQGQLGHGAAVGARHVADRDPAGLGGSRSIVLTPTPIFWISASRVPPRSSPP
jgi:hypothetical protein